MLNRMNERVFPPLSVSPRKELNTNQVEKNLQAIILQRGDFKAMTILTCHSSAAPAIDNHDEIVTLR